MYINLYVYFCIHQWPVKKHPKVPCRFVGLVRMLCCRSQSCCWCSPCWVVFVGSFGHLESSLACSSHGFTNDNGTKVIHNFHEGNQVLGGIDISIVLALLARVCLSVIQILGCSTTVFDSHHALNVTSAFPTWSLTFLRLSGCSDGPTCSLGVLGLRSHFFWTNNFSVIWIFRSS